MDGDRQEDPLATLAFCGVGRMGEPMANRLLEAGHDLVVWNRTPERVEGLVERGARRAGSPAEAAESAEAVITMLATPEALEAVVFGDGGGGSGLARGLGPGATLIDMSTVGPDTVRRVAGRLPDGVEVLDAPVLGSVPQATDGTLKVFVGGAEEVFERWRPVLEELGHPVRMGPSGAGAAMKLVANSTLGAIMTGLGEALALADSLGLQEGQVLDVLAESPVGTTVKSKRSNVETGEYAPNFALALAAKDLRLVAEEAERGGVDARVAAAARAHLEAAAEAGLGDLDYSAVIAHIRGREATGPR
jgi:3-hydroxyisobutyrate dehydrogenase-like beta-hydroxyacid dehydrogenase